MMKNRKTRRETKFLGEIYLFSLISNRTNSIITRCEQHRQEALQILSVLTELFHH
ncbi:MAG: hypothetical protein FWH31_10165 [Streptococcaceae bacterium]|nr:hypothetical protein [Streptococcaceae bacterium]